MLTTCERRLLAFYLANAASGLHHRDREASALAVASSAGAQSPATPRRRIQPGFAPVHSPSPRRCSSLPGSARPTLGQQDGTSRPS